MPGLPTSDRARYLLAVSYVGARATVVATTVALALIQSSSVSSQNVAALEFGEGQPGGEATARSGGGTSDAFSQFSANMPFAREMDFKVGDGVFRKQWVSSPSSTRSSNGLGPLFNARSCQSCHVKDGRGRPPRSPEIADRSVSMFLRLSIPPQTEEQHQALSSGRTGVVPDPTYGTQLQELAIQGHAGEGRMIVTYDEQQIALTGGEIVSLRKPTYRIADLGYGPVHPNIMLSPRLAPQMIGLGLLEAIAEDDILEHEDGADRDGDGVKGRANWIWSNENERVMLGRFGWKAGQPTVLQQTAEAFAGDIGISSWMAPNPSGDCMPAQAMCRDAPQGGGGQFPNEEIKRNLLDLVGFYARNLAVPARRTPDAKNVLAGKALFHAIGCAACHRPSHVTGAVSRDPHLNNQRIWPYTDLLLHDMGDGLADHRPEARATGREWRTAPLWGIGLTDIVNGHNFYLHDGRARSITEAILWHDGEAKRARDAFSTLTPKERSDVVTFVNSL
jgi:CxxC motif-containing protein (DUF1111 family)